MRDKRLADLFISSKRKMSSFVRVAVDESLVDEAIELPTEENSTLLLDSLKSQYGGATGLKYRNSETGGWRGVRLSDGALHPPHGLWGDTTYIVVSPNIKAQAKEHSSGILRYVRSSCAERGTL